jgi:hypothetical protein
VGTTLFDDLIREGEMPLPVKIRGRRVWDREQLHLAFKALVGDSLPPNEWDELKGAA